MRKYLTKTFLVGRITDKLVSYGGSAILTEVPEMFGAETILMNRCKDEELFQKTVNRQSHKLKLKFLV